MCCGCWRQRLFAVAVVFPRLRGPRDRCCSVLARVCSFCFSRCWCRCWRANSSNGSSGAAGRLSAAKPMLSTSRPSPGPKPMPAFRQVTPSRPLRWRSRLPRFGRGRGPAMIVYAILIAASRLVLLAHHPSDVVAGALIGVIGAMFVRYWFAARRVCDPPRRHDCAPTEHFPAKWNPVSRRKSLINAGILKGVARKASAP